MEEFNWSNNSAPEFFDWHNNLFVADVIGHVLSAGGHATFYADSNGFKGLMNDGSTSALPGSFASRFPAWWAIFMWTIANGDGLLRYGSHFLPCTVALNPAPTAPETTENMLTAYACDNGKINVINKTASDITATFSMTGKTSGGWDAWCCKYASISVVPLSKMNPTQATTYSKGTFTQYIPAQSIVSFTIG